MGSSRANNPVIDHLVHVLAGLGEIEGEDFVIEDLVKSETLESQFPQFSSQSESAKVGHYAGEWECCFEGVRYWYHPDYLGSVDMITDESGTVYQYFLYNPWGEELNSYSQPNGEFSSPYKFNGKELDEETGLAYYGARYYDNQLSMWLSVDPLASKYPSLTPYNFVANSPISFVDPDGNRIVFAEGSSFFFKFRVVSALAIGWLFSSTARSNINTALLDTKTHTIYQHSGPFTDGKPNIFTGSRVMPKKLEEWINNFPSKPPINYDIMENKEVKDPVLWAQYEKEVEEYKKIQPRGYENGEGDGTNIYINMGDEYLNYIENEGIGNFFSSVMHEFFHVANISKGQANVDASLDLPTMPEENNAVDNTNQVRQEINNARNINPFLRILMPQLEMREEY